METETGPARPSLNWLEIWRNAFLHPTIPTFSEIAGDPKASLRWGILWAAVTALITWALDPQRTLLWGWVNINFGPRGATYFLVIGTILSPVLGVLALLIFAALSHGLARLFKGAGTYRQLVFCWGVMQLPFILFAGLAFNLIPSLSNAIYRLFSSGATNFSVLRLTLLVAMLVAVAGLLYLAYAQLVAFSAVEKFGLGKGFGLLILLAIIVAIAAACLATGFQAVLANYLYMRY